MSINSGIEHIGTFHFQPKERGSTRVHALNNVNRVLQVLHQNNVSIFSHNFLRPFFPLIFYEFRMQRIKNFRT